MLGGKKSYEVETERLSKWEAWQNADLAGTRRLSGQSGKKPTLAV